MERIDTNEGIEYRGHDNPTDFSQFGQIMIGLKKQSWFMDNASMWLFCNNDDVDDPNDFSKEDFLPIMEERQLWQGGSIGTQI